MIQILVGSPEEIDKVTQRYREYEEKIEELENSVNTLQRENSDLKVRIQELECCVDPFSNDGDAICNFNW